MIPSARLPQSVRRSVAGVFFCSLTAASASAQSALAPEQGRYFDPMLLGLLIFYCVAFIAIFDWLGRDVEKTKLKQTLWPHLIMAVGIFGLIMIISASMWFFLPFLLGLLAVFTIYVIQRNTKLPEEQRIMTGQHFGFLWRKSLHRLGMRKEEGSVMRIAKKEASSEIILLRKDGQNLEKLTQTRDSAGASEAVVSIKELIESAVLSRATDIHIEPKENELQARFRIDGILHNVPSYPPQLAAPMISCVKVLSDMDIAEKRKPQDGTFMGKLDKRALDFRVATSPSVHGETMVIRILDRDAGLIRLERVGLLSDHLEAVRRIVAYPHGMMIVSGPTGAGKSTTLYAMVSEIDAFQKNIVTIEDPIEYRLDNVTQTAVNLKAGVTFASTLRSVLRQDPDVIMVGEIRDAETARTAAQSAMTGHFVFTTLHANDAITSLFRLLDLGVEPYLISSSLTAVMAQRLVRVLCKECKVAYVPQPEFLKNLGVDSTRQVQLYKAGGCEACQGTGYRGRVGIFELFELNDPIRDLIRSNPSIQLIRQEARQMGMRNLQEDGLAKVLKGITSVKELIRVTR